MCPWKFNLITQNFVTITLFYFFDVPIFIKISEREVQSWPPTHFIRWALLAELRSLMRRCESINFRQKNMVKNTNLKKYGRQEKYFWILTHGRYFLLFRHWGFKNKALHVFWTRNIMKSNYILRIFDQNLDLGKFVFLFGLKFRLFRKILKFFNFGNFEFFFYKFLVFLHVGYTLQIIKGLKFFSLITSNSHVLKGPKLKYFTKFSIKPWWG